jgi:lysophospholipase L1-like esterase
VDFRRNLRALLEDLVKKLGSARRVIAVTIPDFSVAPAAPRFGDREQLRADIQRRNGIIAEEATRAEIAVADIFDRSREAAKDATLLAKDGIHPSAAGYAAWVPDVLPALERVLNDRER